MKRFAGIFLMAILTLVSCSRMMEETLPGECYPEGTPVTLKLGFGTPDFLDVNIGTKAEASAADESRVRELYVLLFDQDGNKFYGRNFSYSQKIASLSTLINDTENDGWYIETDNNGVTTRGVVKLSTVSKPNCTLVVLANVSNTISHIGTSTKVVDYLAGIRTLEQLKESKVSLEQDIVTRSDLFLMMGTMENVNTGELIWGTLPDNYNEGQILLKTLDAKVKFRVKYNTENIDPKRSYSRNWRVHNVPTGCYLFEPTTAEQKANSSEGFFTTEEAFFDATETDDSGNSWEVFTFYMLENYQTGTGATQYNDRERQAKISAEDGYVENGNWIYAPAKGTYVWFDMVLGLTDDGVSQIMGDSGKVAQAITSKAEFTVHLGDFTTYGVNDYTVNRNHCYTYNVTIQNTRNIYVEVEENTENQPGQEGSLLLVAEGIVNCDSHYEYHDLVFKYNEDYLKSGIAWYIKTPFSKGGEGECKDYLWVKFAVNDLVNDHYTENRKAYPTSTGEGWVAYDPAWKPEDGTPRPPLMDVNQLVKYIVNETRKEKNNPGTSDYRDSLIHVTAYVDEYYYEFDPREYEPRTVADVANTPTPNPDLWRQFVNQPPRELHILSETKYSQDRQSDVILANNSIIQQSIQTFYNIYSPDLHSIWGTEHLDEMEYRTRIGKDGNQIQWPWWPSVAEVNFTRSITGTIKNGENGRINTAVIWGLNTGAQLPWDQFLEYNVTDNTPELKYDRANHDQDFAFMAYSCLTRNRDNNFNGVIDPEEVRWYIASIDQLVGMWVGNESLTPSARLYHPMDAANTSDGTQWRSWVISSTGDHVENPNIIRAEEGCTKSDYNFFNWADNNGVPFTEDERNKVSSIRCVRNIGTYQDGGVLKDISYAPYERLVDEYYELPAGSDANGKALPNADGTYTIRFSRLNSASIREYTAEDLPYHDEFSIHNDVYQELVVQNPAEARYADGELPARYPEENGDILDEMVMNNAITSQGHNYYCPEGYRLPNMRELLMMERLLPTNYWNDNRAYPCRSYYSHGKLGSNPVDNETQKIGWSKQKNRVALVDEEYRMTGLRCVRDESRTGVITGVVTVKNGQHLRHDEDMTVQINISSLGSAIRDLDISLVYTTAYGTEETLPITPAGLEVSGITYRKDVVCHLPNYDVLPILGNMSVRVSVRNYASSTPKVFEAPITLLSPVFTSLRLLHCSYNEEAENPPFPVLATANSATPITRMTLKVLDPAGITRTVSLFNDANSTQTHLSILHPYLYRTSSSQSGSAPVLTAGTYTFQLEVVSEGKTTRSDLASMEILQVNYQPNPGIAGTDYLTSNDISVLWEPQQIDNLDFFSGDFIEANMDVSSCTYYLVNNENGTRNDNLTIGRDDLISVGLTGTDYGTGMTMPYVFHIYFPAHDGNSTSGEDWLRPNPSTSAGNSNGYNYKDFQYGAGTGFMEQMVSGKPYGKPDISKQQHYRFDQNGVFWNNQLIDLDKFSGDSNVSNAKATFNTLRDASTLFVGSTQGFHHSRARYHFVRVVYNTAAYNEDGGGSHFDDDPQNGGNL